MPRAQREVAHFEKQRGDPLIGEQETATLAIQEPLNEAVELLRRALAERGLEIAADLDTAGRIRKALRIDSPPCRVLCVDCPVALLEALPLDQSAAVLLPSHLVVTGPGRLNSGSLSEPFLCPSQRTARDRAGCGEQTTGQSRASGRKRIHPAESTGTNCLKEASCFAISIARLNKPAVGIVSSSRSGCLVSSVGQVKLHAWRRSRGSQC
jgi:hypothetical protein